MIRIRDIDCDPLISIDVESVLPAGLGSEIKSYPVLAGRCMGLPSQLDALIVTGDLQGINPDDTQEDERELAGCLVARELARLGKLGNLPRPSRTGVLLTGDFFMDRTLMRRGVTGDIQTVWRAFADRFRWVVGVSRNHDLLQGRGDCALPAAAGEAQLLRRSATTVDDMTIAGLSGIVGKPSKPWCLPELEYLTTLDVLLDGWPDILLLHEAPASPSGSGKGRLTITDRILSAGKPLPFFFDHAYWHQLLVESEGWQFVNVDSRVLILEREDDEIPGETS